MAEPPVVSNTSPLINLVGIGHLDLLPRLYGAVSIPRAVLQEFNDGRRSSDPHLTTLSWLTIVDDAPLDPVPAPGLGEGERAAMALAKMLSARLVLIDEDRARKEARRLGLTVAGTLAVLLRAKRMGILPTIVPSIQIMIDQNRYFSPHLLESVLREAGEYRKDE